MEARQRHLTRLIVQFSSQCSDRSHLQQELAFPRFYGGDMHEHDYHADMLQYLILTMETNSVQRACF